MEVAYRRMFNTSWQAFISAHQLPPLAIGYNGKKWISRQIYSVNKHMHVDHLSSSRAESAHSKLKTWLETSTGNLFSCWTKLKETLLSMHQTYDNTMSEEQIKGLGIIQNNLFYGPVTRQVSRFALKKVINQEE